MERDNEFASPIMHCDSKPNFELISNVLAVDLLCALLGSALRCVYHVPTNPTRTVFKALLSESRAACGRFSSCAIQSRYKLKSFLTIEALVVCVRPGLACAIGCAGVSLVSVCAHSARTARIIYIYI